ncbi:MAG TPA: DUF2752 domain-containing protein [Acidimicrobiales bacterium]|nr:DUF2752 domain-containing protein [Acidimicrobiales bacterium]
MLLHVWQTRTPEPSHEHALFRWAERDRVPVLSAAALVGVVAATLLAAFGVPPVSIHAPPHFVGIMDPFCGMTRGVAAVARGDLAEAWWFNPASPLVVVASLVMLSRSAYGVTSGRWLEMRIAHRRLMVAVVLVAMAVLEVNQQLHVDRLR